MRPMEITREEFGQQALLEILFDRPTAAPAKVARGAQAHAIARQEIEHAHAIEPREVVYVGSEVSGTVARLVARANDLVLEGAELGQLDDQKILLKLDEAAALWTGVAPAAIAAESVDGTAQRRATARVEPAT